MNTTITNWEQIKKLQEAVEELKKFKELHKFIPIYEDEIKRLMKGGKNDK